MLIGIFRVSGHSMLPTLRPGRLVVVSSIPYFFLQPKPGDIVLFKQELKTLIKRIRKIEKAKYFVEGENQKDSLKIEPLLRNQILAKCILY